MGQSFMAYGTWDFLFSYMAVLAECKLWLVSAGSTNAALLSFFLVSQGNFVSQQILHLDHHSAPENVLQGIKTTFNSYSHN